MKMGFKEFMKKLLGLEDLPIWAYGLECEVCKRTFSNAETHHAVVLREQKNADHIGKIPVLRRK